jgi:hypothetical protein
MCDSILILILFYFSLSDFNDSYLLPCKHLMKSQIATLKQASYQTNVMNAQAFLSLATVYSSDGNNNSNSNNSTNNSTNSNINSNTNNSNKFKSLGIEPSATKSNNSINYSIMSISQLTQSSAVPFIQWLQLL